jgi:hypothetical protein
MDKIVKLSVEVGKIIEKYEGHNFITWEDVFRDYGKIGYTNAKMLSKWLQENYKAPVKK